MSSPFAGLVGEEVVTVVTALTETIEQLEAEPSLSPVQQVTLRRRRHLRDRLRKAI